ncbi:TetR family transcriptional regulator [Nonomuraea sp. NPDC026600]|uniref:TetR family transcriptional regulator n=1 Tax=Nonomuraea sp. NPDC026600 TaxID=3155363 RepID=UPI0033E589A3
MGDVAEAVLLHRRLVYLHFKSKDELVEAVLIRELDRYAETWRAGGGRSARRKRDLRER